jgi:hypothetical protein
VMGKCKAETDAFRRSLPNKAPFGQCLLACGSEQGCVGPADSAGCACQMACYKTLSGQALENAKTAARCYKKAVAAACE